jgi:hypothetical protein
MDHIATERPSRQASPILILVTFTVSVFLSALLLFGVQPMFTRMVLPRLGGSPSVWSVAMVFFQTMLLAGYAYAHWLSLLRNRLAAILIHLALLACAAAMLPLSIAQGWGEPPSSGTEFWLLGLFTVSIGVPFFALAANNPLLQTWFVGSGHRDGKDPYFLYAASNIGSFLALLSYPILLEPMLSLRSQGQVWSAGFVLLALLITACAVLLLRAPANADTDRDAPPVEAKPSWLSIGRWTFLAAVPSGLLVAVTAYITTDVASAPLLWVMPLSLYLLTWVMVFQRRPLLSHAFMLRLQPFAIAAILALLQFNGWLTLLPNLAAHLLAFFIIAMASHGELAAGRPASAHLTAFYVSLSFGGMIGGLFAGLVAPYAFSWIAEYPILVVLAVLCRPATALHRPGLDRWFWPIAGLGAVVLLIPALLGFRVTGVMVTTIGGAVLLLALASIGIQRAPLKSAFIVALAFAVIRLYPAYEGRRETVRSFFGVNTVYETANGRFRVLKHGTTIHGAQRLLTDDGVPVTGHPEPLTYYHRNSPMARTIEAVRSARGRPIRVGVIGLGAGSLSCWMHQDENWRFFEIDPTVIAIARDPKQFNFISACAPHLDIVLGDARLTLAKEPDHVYDLIIVDAYSSDAIPVHLATREAMAIYKAKLAPHGVVAMHITNHHLELQSVTVGIAAANGLKTWRWSNPDDRTDFENFKAASQVVISAAAAEDIGELAHSKVWLRTDPDPALRTWTDDYSNIAGAFWRKLMQPRAK